jgi:hypothetical protein
MVETTPRKALMNHSDQQINMGGRLRRTMFAVSPRLRLPASLAAILYLLSSILASASAQEAIYPLPGHLDPAEGTIEFWMRLEQNPDPSSKDGVSYFNLFHVLVPGEPNPRIRLFYQTVWTTNVYHFSLSTIGVVNGEFVANSYTVTAEEGTGPLKGETAANPYPRIPRLKAGDWHHLAITWKGLPQNTVTLYFDGKVAIPSVLLHAPLWEGFDAFHLHFAVNPYANAHTLDELRISAVARTPEEIKASFAEARAKQDRHTLLLDHFEELREVGGKKYTVPEVFNLGMDVTGGQLTTPHAIELIEGKSGKAAKFIRTPPKN